MSDIIIAVDNLSKRYLVGHHSAQFKDYTTLRDVIARESRNFARKAVDFAHGRQIVQGDEIEEFWALRDVNFEVKRGEALGIIGRNGAGKSTLLKVLSRITEPTKGRIRIHGRVASLLEVGTGFHPELTGRENIYLNGAILGMTRAEIRRKFDEIVAFAEVERFLDTPVKRYSSGMYVRLAFAVAAHLESEIIILDEVLSVGDVDFQKKCLTKMRDVISNDGRTILFVSHNMAAIESMCDSAILMVDGRSVTHGQTPFVVQEYLRDVSRINAMPLDKRTDRVGSGDIRFLSVSLEGHHGSAVSAFRCGDQAILRLAIENRATSQLRNFHISLGIDDEMGQRVALLDTILVGADMSGLPRGQGAVRVVIPKMVLIPGRYQLTLYSTVNGIIADWIKNGAVFDVEAGNYYGTGQLPPHGEGMFLLDHQFIVSDRRAEFDMIGADRTNPLPRC